MFFPTTPTTLLEQGRARARVLTQALPGGRTDFTEAWGCIPLGGSHTSPSVAHTEAEHREERS
jgi:hypothetical protein